MTVMRSITARAKFVAALTALLIVIGAGSAAAYWTASAQLSGEASAAKAGITQTDPLNLKTVYNSGNLKAADTVTIQNTGTAPAALSVTVTAQGGAKLPSVLRFAIAKKPGTTDCGPHTALERPFIGGIGLMYSGTLEAGESIDLCVRTSIPARSVFGLAGEQTGIAVTSTLKYADGDNWSTSSSGKGGAPFAQSVQGDPAAGVPAMTCREREILDSSTWYSLRFSYAGTDSSAGGEFRAYLLHGDRIIDIPRSKTTFHVSGKTVSTQIADSELVKIGGDVGVWQSVNARVIVEKKTAGQEEWTTAATGKIRVEGFLLANNNAYCGWK